MTSLGFRPPQFSQECAWLPAWLQQRQEESSEDDNKESHTLSGQEHTRCINKGATEEGGYNSCHLFLSGVEDSPLSLDPSPQNALHFRLYLSLEDSSRNMSILYSEKNLESHESKYIPQMQHAENLYDTGEKVTQTKMDYTIDLKSLLPQNSNPNVLENGSFNDLTNNDNRLSGEKFETRNLKVNDIDAAVELSITASEALVILDVLHGGLPLEALSAATVLEVALRVKQARLERLEAALDFQDKDDDEIDFLLDLDESSMGDAFEDIGLSDPSLDDLCMSSTVKSQVEGTFISLNSHVCDDVIKNVESRFHEADLNILKQNVGDDLVMDLASMNNFTSKTHDNEGKKKCPEDQYLQEVYGSERRLPNITISIPNRFIPETSFLSESSDYAPDEKSFAREQSTGLKGTSHSSIPLDSPSYRSIKRTLLSQEVTRSPTLSLSDPLCSIVPCSLNPGNADLIQSQNHNDTDHADLTSCTISKLPRENLNADCARADALSMRRVDVVRSKTIKAYSIPSPTHSTNIKKDHPMLSGYNLELHRRDSISFTPSSHISTCTAGRNCKKDYEVHVSGTSLTKFTDRTNSDENRNDEADIQINVKDGAELEVHPLTEKSSALILEEIFCHHLQVSKPSRNNVLCLAKEFDENRKNKSEIQINVKDQAKLGVYPLIDHLHAPASKAVANIHQRLQSNCSNNDIQVPARKRVRFSEAEIELQQNKNYQKLKFELEHRSTKTGNWLRQSNKQPSRNYVVKTLFWNRDVYNIRRLIFQGMAFLLTGFCNEKRKKIQELAREYGGLVLSDIPSPGAKGKRKRSSSLLQHPIVLCVKKLQSTKFLYGCAVKTFILKVDWLTESIAAGSLLSPEKYMILSYQDAENCGKNKKYIFEGVGVMLHGEQRFCTKISKVFKHGGGRIFKTLHWLLQSLNTGRISLGAIVVENGSMMSRHLKHCALESKIQMISANWIINSLYKGKLFPFPENVHLPASTTMKCPLFPSPLNWSD